MAFYGRLFYTLRMLVKPIAGLKESPDLSKIPTPAVYICRHRNMRGPIYTLLHLPRDVHPWVLSVFCDKNACYKHYTDYTFSVRLKWHPLSTRFMAWIVSRIVPAIAKSARGIPVFRKSFHLRKTFSLSLDALRRGENLVIYPDVDYVSTADVPGEIYKGFLTIGNLYRKATGKNLHFVPLDISMKERKILVGKPIEFNGKTSFSQEQQRVAAALVSEWNRLSTTQEAPR